MYYGILSDSYRDLGVKSFIKLGTKAVSVASLKHEKGDVVDYRDKLCWGCLDYGLVE